MKSKIADKIEKETPKELTEKVRTDTNLFLSGVSVSVCPLCSNDGYYILNDYGDTEECFLCNKQTEL